MTSADRNQRTFFQHFSHFITGRASILLIGFFTFPILTRNLSVEQYGILTLITNTMAMAVTVGKLGLSDGIIRFHEEYADDNSRRAVFSSSLVIGGLLLSLITSTLYISGLPFLYDILKIAPEFKICFLLMTLYLFVRPINIICLNLMRANYKTVTINILNFLSRIFEVSIGLPLLLYFIQRLYGYFIGAIIAEYIIFLILVHWLITNYKIKINLFSIDLARKISSFGLPLLFSEISYLLLSYADRYIILFYHGEKELGLYSVGYNLAMYLANLVTFSVSYAIVPIYIKIYAAKGKKETEIFLQDSFYYLLIGIIPMCFGYFAVSRDLFVLLASEKYIEASSFSPLILYGSLFLGLNTILNAGLYVHKKTLAIFAIMSTGVLINIFLNIFLVPKYNVIGAAWATLISCFATTIITVSFSYRLIFIRIKKEILYHAALSIFMFFSIASISTDSLMVTLMCKLSLGFLIVFSGVLFREKKILMLIKEKMS
ncbi:MAG: oligosaccharide flippase family protein [Parachlamydiaceae bacterium]|nr:oligosaccharide flippase family protein [Parachlamydiaceae bacterium]